MLCGAGRDRDVLTQQLQRLGIVPVVVDAMSEPVAQEPCDLVFIDVDVGRHSPALGGGVDIPQDRPVLALIGSDVPSAVEWVIEQGACGYLVKPIRGTGILASLVIACHVFEERTTSTRTISELRHRLKARQLVCSAAIRIIDVFGIGEDEAFHVLKIGSMERRTTVEDLAAMIVSGELSVQALGSDVEARRLRV